MATAIRSATGLTGRYATALFELALAQGALASVVEDFKSLSRLLNDSNDLKRMVRSPVISRTDQWNAVQLILKKGKASSLTLKFVGLICRNRRLYALDRIIRDFLSILAEYESEIEAEVVSATPLNKKQMNALLAGLNKSITGTVSVNSKVDPNLLGGLIIKIGSRMIDSSLKNKLQQLRIAMRGVG